MAIDVDVVADEIHGTPTKGRKSRADQPERQESFIRGDKTRRALHRRTPSAPNTPRNDRSASSNRPNNGAPQKTFSQPALENSTQHHYNGDESYSSESMDEDAITFRPRHDPATLVKLEQQGKVKFMPRSEGVDVDGKKSSSRSAEELTAHKRGAKASPQSRKKAKGCGEKTVGFVQNDEDMSQNNSTSSAAVDAAKSMQVDEDDDVDAKTKPIETQYFYSRHHDYAEILSDGESGDRSKGRSASKETLINGEPQSKESSFVCSPTSMSSLIDHIDRQFSGRVKFRLNSPETPSPENRQETPPEGTDATRDLKDFKELQFERTSPADKKPHLPSSIEVIESNIKKIQQKPQPHMTKCLSVPSDIAKSLENVTSDSNYDLMSSVTISELSQSVDSFNLSLGDSCMGDARRRRSASLDSLTDSPMTRTLREINLQIDTAFKRDVDRALELEDKGYQRHASAKDVTPLHIEEDIVTPTNPPEMDFPEYARIDRRKNTSTAVNKRHSGLFIEVSPDKKMSPTKEFDIISGNIRSPQRKVEFLREDSFQTSVSNKTEISACDSSEKPSYVDRPSEIRIVETPAPQVVRAPVHVQQQKSVEQASISNIANLRAQQVSSSSSSSSSSSDSDSETESSTASDSIASSVEFISHKHSGASPQPPPSQAVSDTLVTVAGSKHIGYSYEPEGVDSIKWSQSPVFADVGHRKSGSKTSPVDSLGIGRASPSVHFGSTSSADSSPRPSPRASPRQFMCGSDSSSTALIHNQDHVCSGRLTVPEDSCLPPQTEWMPVPAPRKHLLHAVHSDTDAYSHTQNHQGSKFMSSYPCFSNGQVHSSPSLPEVHVDHDTVTLEKPTIKRSTTESVLADRTPAGGEQRRELFYTSQTFPRKDADRKHAHGIGDVSWQYSKISEPMDVTVPHHPTPTPTHAHGAHIHHHHHHAGQRSDSLDQMQQKSDLLDVVNLPGFRSHISDLLEPETPNTSTSFTVSPVPRPPSQSCQAMEVEASVEISGASYSSPSPGRYCMTTSSSSTSSTMTSPGSLDRGAESEILENIINSGKEMLRSHRQGQKRDQSEMNSQHVPLLNPSRSDSVLSPSSLFTEPPSHRSASATHISSSLSSSSSSSSSHKTPSSSQDYSADLAPPTREIMEVKRPTLKRGDKSPSLPRQQQGQDDISRTVVVKEITSQTGDAKLVIERKPNLKKNIQTVHSRKVPHPRRQIAEAVDDVSDSATTTPELSSTGPSDADPSGVSSQDDEDVFSDASADAFARFSSRTRPGDKGHFSVPAVKSATTGHFDDMVGSRSSLDESVLQLASERHDIFGANDGGDYFGFNTGSLRARRSQKMQSLVDLFEKASDPNLSSESGCRGDDRRLSMSLPTPTPSEHQSERDQDTDDEAFFPRPGTRASNASSLTRRSRSRERMRKTLSDKENRISSRSPTPNRRQLSTTLSERYAGGQVQVQPSSPALKDYRAKYTSFSKPPRYRSGSRGRTHSESSTSESESSQHLDASFHGRHGDWNASASGDVVLRDMNSSRGDKKCTLLQREGAERTPDRTNVQRRGSIKELMDFFESRQGDESSSTSGSTSTPSTTPTPTQTRRSRIHSSSPVRDELSLATRDVSSTSSYRLSVEIPGSVLSDASRKPQHLRLGPKPFYGAK